MPGYLEGIGVRLDLDSRTASPLVRNHKALLRLQAAAEDLSVELCRQLAYKRERQGNGVLTLTIRLG